jgi:putative heme transporter
MLAGMPVSSRTQPARAPRGSPWRIVVSTAVTVVVLLVVFVGIFPKVADYSEAWSSIQQMPTAFVVALGVATVLNVAVYVWPLQAALPGLGYGPGFVVRQTSFAISNAVPAGGAVGLGVQYGMLDSYGFGAGAAASAIAIVSVFNVFATLVMPVIGVLALLAGGVVEGTYLLMAAIGVAAIVVGVVAFAVVLRSERGARRVGHWADRLAHPLTRRVGHGRTLDLTGKILDFRSSVVDVMQTRWWQVTLSTLLLQLTSWAILVLALRGLEAGTGTVTVTWTEALAAFSFARVASFIPITPGGLGTVDAALAALLTGYGASSSQALAADLVWRAATYVPQVLLGVLTFLWWRVTAARRTRRAAKSSAAGEDLTSPPSARSSGRRGATQQQDEEA